MVMILVPPQATDGRHIHAATQNGEALMAYSAASQAHRLRAGSSRCGCWANDHPESWLAPVRDVSESILRPSVGRRRAGDTAGAVELDVAQAVQLERDDPMPAPP